MAGEQNIRILPEIVRPAARCTTQSYLCTTQTTWKCVQPTPNMAPKTNRLMRSSWPGTCSVWYFRTCKYANNMLALIIFMFFIFIPCYSLCSNNHVCTFQSISIIYYLLISTREDIWYQTYYPASDLNSFFILLNKIPL